MFTTRERIYSPPQHRQSLPLSHNPDSRVSKVFNVTCLPRVVSGACPPIYLLQGGAYCLCERASHIDSNDTCRKLHPLFNLQIPPEPVSIKDTHQRKEESMKKSMSRGINHLRIFLTNILYHRPFKKLWYMFWSIRAYHGAFLRIF